MLTTTLFVVLCILQINDAVTTHYAIRRGLATESFRLTRWLIARIRLLPAMLVKTLVVTAAAWFAEWWALAFLCLVYAAVVWNNFNVILAASAKVPQR